MSKKPKNNPLPPNGKATSSNQSLGWRSRLAQWLNSSETPRWVIITGFLLTTIFGTAIGLFTDNYKRQADFRLQNVKALTDTMAQFLVHATAFNAELLDKKSVSQETRRALQQNISEQYARLKSLEDLLPETSMSDVAAYRAALVRIQESVAKTDSPETMGAFWTEASRLLIARNRLNSILRNSI